MRTTNLSKPALLLIIALLGQSLFGWPQDIAGGASSLVGQDIMGGGSVVFRRPPRVRDLSGGAGMLIVRRRAPRRPDPTEAARNKPPRPPQPGQPEPDVKTPQISDEEKAEAYNN